MPISSTGHLILVSDLLNISQTEFVKSFEIIIQLGAILAVVVLYFKTLIFKRSLLISILIAFLPTAIVGLIFYKIIKTYLLGNTEVVLISLFLGGIILILFEWLYKEKETHIKEMEKSPLNKLLLLGFWELLQQPLLP